MDGVQNEKSTGTQAFASVSISNGDENGAMQTRGQDSFTETSTKVQHPTADEFLATEQGRAQKPTSKRLKRRSKSQFSSVKAPSSKLAVLITVVAIIYFLKVYFHRCLVPHLVSSSPSASISPRPLPRGLLLSLSSTDSPAPLAVGSTHSRRLSQREETPLDPVCESSETSDGGEEEQSKNKRKPSVRKDPGANRPRKKRAHAEREATEEEEDDVPKKRTRSRVPRAAAQAEHPEEETEDSVDTTDVLRETAESR
ncbi:UNVERIFIED_CONTAM: transmembrane protein, putative [Hammondia hammondi]|eukprot:XP_008884015.1 transmembrane protein, putative [Hammondia hammondi]